MSSLRLFSCQSVSLALGEERELGPLDLQIYTGDRIALVGPNGSGKSTLLRYLLSQLSGVRVGYLQQDLRWRESASVWQAAGAAPLAELERFELMDPTEPGYADLWDRLVEQDAFQLPQRLEELLSQQRLLDARERSVSTLSGGERMRLGWVRLLAREPELLLLDEPSNHLDRQHRSALMELLDAWKGECCTGQPRS